MKPDARHRVAALLGDVAAPGSFSVHRRAPVDDLHVEVRGLGRLRMPVSIAQAKQLCALGRPARYGRGEETLLDARVRDTWEIPRSRVKVDKRRWNQTLVPMLDRLRADLGLPAACRIDAQLHSMLVYAPGQFFVTHQDSEKNDSMIASLVVTLPTSASGGALVIDHGGARRTHRPSKTELSFVAFYADCRHEVRPVTSGYRIALTYNLLVDGDTTGSARESTAGIDALVRGIDEHFTTPRASVRLGATRREPPNRLVHLLDHEYTARGLNWSRLKGDDARRAGALRTAAEQSDCEIVLALADVHETWGCLEPGYDELARGRSWRPSDDDVDGYELEELVDSTITLTQWVDPREAAAEPVTTDVDDSEACATTPSVSLRPYRSEYEGYMGNYGNTMDRWYRRAALVLWPRRHAFAVRAEASPTWALRTLAASVRAGDVPAARAMASTMAPFWRDASRRAGRGAFASTARLASRLDDAAVATMLLEPFSIELVTRANARSLAVMVDVYGEHWVRQLVDGWFRRPVMATRRAEPERAAWIASLATIGAALEPVGANGSVVAAIMVERSWAWIREALDDARVIVAPSRREQALTDLAAPLLGVLRTVATMAVPDRRDEMLEFLCDGTDDLMPCLMSVLRAARPSATTPSATTPATTAARAAAGLDTIAQYCMDRIGTRLAAPPRADDDWTIDLPDGCRCELCQRLGAFLAARSTRTTDWPLAKEGRLHVHTRIDGAELPVRHLTKRTGRPYTLVLTKTAALFERESEARRRAAADLAWLERRHTARAAATSRR